LRLKKYSPYIALALLIVVYFSFPNNNLTIDSWYYAACVKFNFDIYSNSHHLLHNYFGLKTFQFLSLFTNSSALQSLQLMNASAAALCLIVFVQIIKLAGYSTRNAVLITSFCGATFGFLRFATDAETYILPVLWTLCSAYFYLKSENIVYTALASLFAVVAVCTHQLQIWWALALFIHLWFYSSRTLISKFVFSTLLLLIPFIYFQCYVMDRFCNVSFLGFLLGQYGTGGASLDLSLNALLLTFVNFFRTFLQVHGQISFWIAKYPYLSLLTIVALIKILMFIWLRRHDIIHFQKTKTNNTITIVFLLTGVFNLLFAFLSSGNAEFMVMLPFMLTAYMSFKYSLFIRTRFLLVAAFMSIWNIYFGLLPNCIDNLTKTDRQTQWYINYPEAYFVFENKPQVENQVCYQTNFDTENRFITIEDISKHLDSGRAIYTDVGLKTTRLSRASLLKKEQENVLLNSFKMNKVDSFQNLYGKNYIYLISKKDEKSIFAP
jgi:hypothetical protein